MDGGKKQVPLRLSKALYEQLAAWAADDFRSVNGQIEFLLSQCVRQRRRREKDIPMDREDNEPQENGE